MIVNPGLPTQAEIDTEAPHQDAPTRRAYDRNRCTCPRHGQYDSGRTGYDPYCTEHGLGYA